jgi:hypothetical protein
MRILHMEKYKYDNSDSDPEDFNSFNGYRQRLSKQSSSSLFFCDYIPGSSDCETCPIVSNCPKRGKIARFRAVARDFIKPCKKQPATCSIKNCPECCAVRENENLFLIALRRALNDF